MGKFLVKLIKILNVQRGVLVGASATLSLLDLSAGLLA